MVMTPIIKVRMQSNNNRPIQLITNDAAIAIPLLHCTIAMTDDESMSVVSSTIALDVSICVAVNLPIDDDETVLRLNETNCSKHDTPSVLH